MFKRIKRVKPRQRVVRKIKKVAALQIPLGDRISKFVEKTRTKINKGVSELVTKVVDSPFATTISNVAAALQAGTQGVSINPEGSNSQRMAAAGLIDEEVNEYEWDDSDLDFDESDMDDEDDQYYDDWPD